MPKVIVAKSLTERLKALLVEWIYNTNVLFSVVEHPTFRKLLVLLNLTVVKEALLKSHNTIKK